MKNDEENEITLDDLLADEDLEYYRAVIVSTVKCLNAIDPQNWHDGILSCLRHNDPLELADSLFHVTAANVDEIKKFQKLSPAQKLNFLASELSQKMYLFVLQERAAFLHINFSIVNAQIATLFLLAQEKKTTLSDYILELIGRPISDFQDFQEILTLPQVRKVIKDGWQNEDVRQWVLQFCHRMSAPAAKVSMTGNTLIGLADAAIRAAYRAAGPETYKEMYGLTDEQIPKRMKSEARDESIEWFKDEVTRLLDVKSGPNKGTQTFNRNEFWDEIVDTVKHWPTNEPPTLTKFVDKLATLKNTSDKPNVFKKRLDKCHEESVCPHFGRWPALFNQLRQSK
ncbi:MAG: hypothetical protein ACJ74W_15360 [Pyrinomonadaceae bacterium]